MIATENTQSLDAFRQRAAETLDRVNQTGEPAVITVNGERRAVLLSPAAYDAMAAELQLARDVDMVRRSRQEFRDGKGIDARAAFDQLRAELLARQAAEDATVEGRR